MKREECEEQAARQIEIALRRFINEKGHAVVGFPGGRSVAGIFSLLAAKELPWENIHIFMVDERLVPIDDPESNYKQLKESLLDKIADRIPKENIHPFIYQPDAPDKGIAAYEQELRAVGGRYDLMLLSSGEDGHIGGLFPQRSVTRDAEFYLIMDDSPKPPPDRMSMSRQLFLKTHMVVLLFFGEGKREAYEKFQQEIAWKELPSKLVQNIPEKFIYTDL